MKKKKLLALLLALVLSLSFVAACGEEEQADDDEKEEKSKEEETEKEEPKKDKADKDEPEEEEEEEEEEEFVVEEVEETEGLDLQQINRISTKDKIAFSVYSGGIRYRNADEKIGVMSHDGKNDTGAIYDYCEAGGAYFKVVTEKPEDGEVNCIGLIDGEGNTIIPEDYAAIDVYSNRFAKAYVATEVTTNPEEVIFHSKAAAFPLTEDDTDTLYKGEWHMYDLHAGEMIEGVTATNANYNYFYGDVIKYCDDDGNYVTVNAKGELLPANANVHSDGSYEIADARGTVYDAYGNVKFTYNPDEMYVYASDANGYYNARSADYSTYFYLDQDGNKSGVTYTSGQITNTCDGLVIIDNVIYDFEGNEIFAVEDEERLLVCKDEWSGNYILKNNSNAVYISEDYEVLAYLAYEDSNIFANTIDFTVRKSGGAGNNTYCIEDGDFTIKGSPLSRWAVYDSTEDTVTDVITGKVVLEDCQTATGVIAADGNYYMYVGNSNGTWDIYLVK